MATGEVETPTTWIFVVSDDPHVRDAAEDGFGASVEVTFASDARRAIETLRLGIPAVVIVDLHAGSAGGFALCRDMKADPRLQSVPVMMLLERDQDAWLSAEAGASAYATKPIESSELVERALSLSAAT